MGRLVFAGRTGRRRGAGLLCAVVLAVLAACGEAGTSGTTNVQGGTGRAPGAPPVGAQSTAAASPTR